MGRMTTYEIPVRTDVYDQQLTVTLSGNPYQIRLTYSERVGCYHLRLTSEDGTLDVPGRPVILYWNLLYATSIPGRLYCQPLRAPNEIPSYGELGTGQRCSLVYEDDT